MTEETEQRILRRIDDHIMEEFRDRLNRQDEHIAKNGEVLTEIRDTLVKHGEILRMQGEMLRDQSKVLTDQKSTLETHIAEENQIKPALEELIALWKGSRLLIPILVATAAAVGTAFVWLRDHLSFK